MLDSPVGCGNVLAPDLRPSLPFFESTTRSVAARGRSEAMPTGVLLGSEARANRVYTVRLG